MLQPAAFSIVACDLEARAWGVAVASKFPAVGSIVPWARAGAGAVATQALANTAFGPRGIEDMAAGLSAQETLKKLLVNDRDREHRQVGIVDAGGNSATYTGKSCPDWAGGASGQGYCVQGNTLSGAEVVREMERAFLATRVSLPERLLAALEAGSKAGGDRRGRQSAALLVVKEGAGFGGHNDRWIDHRVDDHLHPIPRLAELLEMHRLYFGRSPKGQRVRLERQTIRDIQEIMKALGYYTPTDGQYSDATREAFRAFITNENLVARADPDAGWIDAPALDYLLRKLK